jgi:hypothetical protein
MAIYAALGPIDTVLRCPDTHSPGYRDALAAVDPVFGGHRTLE